MKEKIKKICLMCNKNFEVYHSHNFRKFCSKQCMGTYYSKNYAGINSSSWKGKTKKVCLVCGKNFEVYPYKKDTAKFCSKKCNNIYRSKNYIGTNNPHWKEKIKLICKNCNKEFKVYPSIKQRKFCSKKCKNIYFIGENSFNWQGGKSFEPYCEKFNEKKKEEVREQYGRKCYICGKDEKDNITKTGKIWKLSVHHIDEDKEQGCNGKQWKLVPLCLKHHNSKILKQLNGD